MDDKNLDKLFRDKFKAFREVPDEKVWTAIDRSLDKKRKKRVIPLWWQLGGVAAILTIAFMVFYLSDDGLNENPAVTDIEKTDTNRSESTDVERRNQNTGDAKERTGSERMDADRGNQNIIEFDKQDAADTHESRLRNKVDRRQENEKENLENEEQGQENGNQRERNDNQREQNANPRQEDRNLREEGQKLQQEKQKQRLEKRLLIPTNTEEAVAKSSKDASKILNSSQPSSENLAQNDSGSKENKKRENVARPIPKGQQGPADEQIVGGESGTHSKRPEGEAYEQTIKGQRNSSFKPLDGRTDAQVAQRNPESLPDPNADPEPNPGKETADDLPQESTKKSLLDALEEPAENEELVETSRSRWSAGPSIAPVYFDAMGEGSPIDPGFAANTKSGSTNFSYGLSVAYAVTDRLSVRSGLHKIDFGYDTDNVDFSPTLDASSSGRLQNIENTNSLESATVSDASEAESPNSLAQEFSSLSSGREGTVAQQFGYLEVPLEIKYALIDNRFGVNLVGGLSSLFLIDNSVTLNSGDLSTDIGEASNLNDVNFSTNIGFGLNYKVTSAIRLNVEPVFKYQLNTFSNVAGDFRPFSLGIYSGLNFRF